MKLKAHRDKENNVLIPKPEVNLNLFEDGSIDEQCFQQQAFPESMDEEEPI